MDERGREAPLRRAGRARRRLCRAARTLIAPRFTYLVRFATLWFAVIVGSVEFLAHLHKMISKAMNSLRGRWENFWATEQPNAVYLVEPADRFAKLVYLLANPIADHLVDRISDWPGACSLGMHLSGATKTVKRPRGFFRSNGKMPDAVTLRIERPDGFEELSEVAWVAKLRDALGREEQRAREERRVSGRGVLGRKAILGAEPTDSPKTVEARRELRPQLACINKRRRLRELAALIAFRAQRWTALVRYLVGERDVLFPHGTYRVRGRFRSVPDPLATCA
ncbi:MAG TPA: hypothetical protein VM925_01150 [Labilithrix sp.]|nr:hypothetical protein [Labilithrix sp.]